MVAVTEGTVCGAFGDVDMYIRHEPSLSRGGTELCLYMCSQIFFKALNLWLANV